MPIIEPPGILQIGCGPIAAASRAPAPFPASRQPFPKQHHAVDQITTPRHTQDCTEHQNDVSFTNVVVPQLYSVTPSLFPILSESDVRFPLADVSCGPGTESGNGKR